MVTINGIPVYEATMTEGCGIQRVSLVDEPAVMSDFQKFAAEQSPRKYAIDDEEKRIVTGVIARADFPIYRYDKQWGEYYIIFSAETIRTIAERLLKEQKQGEVNLNHVDGSEVQDVDMVEMFIKDSAKGINPEGFDDIADGSLFATYHVNNDEVWDSIKAGDYKGFSMEIIENDIPFEDAAKAKEIVATTEGKFDKIKRKMGKVSRKLLELAKELAKFGSVNTDKAVLFWDGDEDLKAGDKVFTDEERENAAEDGDYVTEDGKTIVVAGGEVSEIRDAEAEVASEVVENVEEEEAPEGEGEAAPEGEAVPSLEERLTAIEEALAAIDNRIAALEGATAVSPDEFAALKADIEAFKKEPAAKTAHQAFKEKDKEGKTSNFGRILNAKGM